MADDRQAVLYRMVLPDHTCPFGLRAKDLLDQAGYQVEEHLLGSREEVEAFKSKENVDTTPIVFIGGERIGGSDELEDYLAEAEA